MRLLGLVSRYDRRPKQRIDRAIAVTDRKAPAFLRGLLSLVHHGAEDEVRNSNPLLGN